MGEELKTYLDGMKAEIKAHVAESNYGVETKLLRALHGWARSMEVRLRTGGQVAASVDERLAIAEERISELERRRDSAA
jgi:hypothetical protein